MRRLLMLLCAAALAACGDDDPTRVQPNAPTGRVRVVNTSPDTFVAKTIDVRVDNQPLNLSTTASALGYGVASPYTPVYVGSREIEVRKGGDSTTTLFTLDATIAQGVDYTVFVTGRGTAIAPVLLTDQTAAPPADSVRVRLVNTAPSAPSVDVYVTSTAADITTLTPTVAGLAVGAASGYLTLPIGSHRIRFTTAGTKTVVRDINPLNLAAGQVRTVVLTDRAGGGTPVTSVVLVDR